MDEIEKKKLNEARIIEDAEAYQVMQTTEGWKKAETWITREQSKVATELMDKTKTKDLIEVVAKQSRFEAFKDLRTMMATKIESAERIRKKHE